MRKHAVEFEAVERSFRENTGIGWGLTLSRWESVQSDKKGSLKTTGSQRWKHRGPP